MVKVTQDRKGNRHCPRCGGFLPKPFYQSRAEMRTACKSCKGVITERHQIEIVTESSERKEER